MKYLRNNIHWCMLLALLGFTQIASSSEKRIALVIGNADYAETPLRNPVNDAQDMSVALRKLGFDVIELTDASRRDMFNGVREFRQKLRGTQALGLFYFAGHGAQFRGQNYLLPVDHQVQAASELQIDSLSAQDVLAQMQEAGNPINVVILDACRNQPFPGSSRNGARGLARMDSISGSLIAYATSPGSIAEDGNGRNGVYTSALLEQLNKPNHSLTDMFNRVGLEVSRATAGKQEPWVSSSPLPPIYLAGKTAEQATTVETTSTVSSAIKTTEITFWQSITNSTLCGDYQAYLSTYPQGSFARLAEARVTAYCTAQSTASTSDTQLTGNLSVADSRVFSTSAVGGDLHFYNWTDYTPDDLLTKFKDDTGITITMETYDSNETLLTTLRSGTTNYDLVVPSSHFISTMIAENLIEEVDVKAMPNFKNVDPNWQAPSWDPDQMYSSPYQWGTSSFAIHTGADNASCHSWKTFFEPEGEACGKVSVFSTPIEVINMAALYLGQNYCDDRSESLKAVQSLLQKQRKCVKYYSYHDFTDSITTKSVIITNTWNSSVMRARNDGVPIQYCYPKEGVVGWFDTLVIPKGAKNYKNATIFMNWLMAPENIAMVSNYAGYSNAIPSSANYIDDKLDSAPEFNVPEGLEVRIIEACGARFNSSIEKIWAGLVQ